MNLLLLCIGCALLYGVVKLQNRQHPETEAQKQARAIRRQVYGDEAQALLQEYGFKEGARPGIYMDTRHKYLPRPKRVVHLDVDTDPENLTRQLKSARRRVDSRAKRHIASQIANLDVPSDMEVLEAQAMVEQVKPKVRMAKGTH